MKQFWDERYRTSDYVYGTDPNDFFREYLKDLPPGNLLLPGEGEGRNAVFASTRGWKVSAYDTSTEGRKKALALAEERGVKIEYTPGSYLENQYQEQPFDLIGLFFTHMPSEMRMLFHQSLAKNLKPDGIVILECFHKEQLGRNTGGPGNLDFLFNEKELEEDFSYLHITHLEKQIRNLQEGLFHTGEAAVIQMIAQKASFR